MATPTIDRVIIPDGLSPEVYAALLEDIEGKIGKRVDTAGAASSPTPDSKVKAPKVLTRKQAIKELKALKKAEKKAARKAQAKKAAQKAKARKAKVKHKPKHKKRKGLAKVTHKIAKGTKKVGHKIANGARRVGRGAKYVGRKMWSWAVTGAKASWQGLKWSGRKLAGAVALVFGTGAKVVGFVVAAVGWTWVMVAIGGLIVLTLVAAVVQGGARTVSEPAAWVSKGRPGSLKDFKAKKKAKRVAARKAAAAKRKAAMDQAKDKKAAAQAKAKAKAKVKKAERKELRAKKDLSKWVKANAELIKEGEKLARKLDQEIAIAERADESYDESEQHLLAKVTARDYAGMTLEEIQIGANMKEAELLTAETYDKKAYSYYSALNNALVAVMTPINSELRGKQLYEQLRKFVLDQQEGATEKDKRVAAQKKFDWTQFQAGIHEVTIQEARIAKEAEASISAGG